MAVLVLEKRKKPLMPCSEKRARIHRMAPFTIRLVDRLQKDSVVQGPVAIRACGSFNIQTGNGLVQGIPHRFCALIPRGNGEGDSWTKIAITEGGAGIGQATPAALSLPGLNPGVSRATR